MSESTSRSSRMADTSEEGGVRGMMNRKPWLPLGIVGGALAVVLFLSFRPVPKQGAFYTIDDGKTTFQAAPQIPPFEYEGKEAVQAMMVSCDGGNTTYVGYLIKYTPEGKKHQEEIAKRGGGSSGPPQGLMVKRPGDPEWVEKSMPRGPGAAAAKDYDAIINLKCPDGKSAMFITAK